MMAGVLPPPALVAKSERATYDRALFFHDKPTYAAELI
jgi:hypothetical protein